MISADRKKLIFIHDGKASYPMIPSLIERFRDGYECSVQPLSEYIKTGDPQNSVLWYMMGFYPKKNRALAHIHFYSSPSVAPFPRTKDMIKRWGTFTPDLRIYQNERVRKEFGFPPGVEELFIQVGASPKIRDMIGTTATATHVYDFGYVGQITRERGMDRVIASFLKRFEGNSSLLLIGPADDTIQELYKYNTNVIFAGKHSQEQAYMLLRSAKVGVAYFPYHRPHSFMIPTKLLEYMAFGMPILANDSPMNLHYIQKYNYPAVVSGADIFLNCRLPDAFPTGLPCTDPAIFLDYQIDVSGVREKVNGLVARHIVR